MSAQTSEQIIETLRERALSVFDGSREVIAVHLSNGQEFLGSAEQSGMRAERSLNYALMVGRDCSNGTPFQQHRVTVKKGENGPDISVINAPSVQPA